MPKTFRLQNVGISLFTVTRSVTTHTPTHSVAKTKWKEEIESFGTAINVAAKWQCHARLVELCLLPKSSYNMHVHIFVYIKSKKSLKNCELERVRAFCLLKRADGEKGGRSMHIS